MAKSRSLDLRGDAILKDRLDWEGYLERKMKSDGNCQFRALADQLYSSPDCHKRVRQEIVAKIKSHPHYYTGFVGKTGLSEYIKNMSNNGVWGDNLTLQAAADCFGVKIKLVTSYKDRPYIVLLPRSQKQPDRVIHLSFLAEVHYNSIYLNNGTSNTVSVELQSKKDKDKDKGKGKGKGKGKKKGKGKGDGERTRTRTSTPSL